MLATIPLLTSRYSSTLTSASSSYNRLVQSTDRYFYESIQILVDKSGLYKISTDSPSLMYVYLYNSTFNVSNPSANMMTSVYDTNFVPNLSFSINLHTRIVYILVITTVNSENTGSFHIIITGPRNAIIIPILIPTTTSGITTTTSQLILQRKEKIF